MVKGIFIVIDGIDGSGTTTHSKLLADWLKTKKLVLLTHEPSENEIGKLIRRLLKTPLPAAVDALLFAADRVLHTEEIKNALNEGKIVISDRYLESSICYQGVELYEEWIFVLNKHAMSPDITIILDIEPEIGLKRKEDASEKFEKVGFLKRVRENFLRRAKIFKNPVINTNDKIEDVQQKIRDLVSSFMKSLNE